jgi:hypothetical protein
MCCWMLQGRVWLPKCSNMSGPAAGRLLLLPWARVSSSLSHDWHMRSVTASQSAVASRTASVLHGLSLATEHKLAAQHTASHTAQVMFAYQYACSMPQVEALVLMLAH